MIIHDGRQARVGSDVGQSVPALIGAGGAVPGRHAAAAARAPGEPRRRWRWRRSAVPIVLLNERFLEWSVLAAGVLLAYLAWRCLAVAAGRAAAAPAGPSGDGLGCRRGATALIAGARGAGPRPAVDPGRAGERRRVRIAGGRHDGARRIAALREPAARRAGPRRHLSVARLSRVRAGRARAPGARRVRRRSRARSRSRPAFALLGALALARAWAAGGWRSRSSRSRR